MKRLIAALAVLAAVTPAAGPASADPLTDPVFRFNIGIDKCLDVFGGPGSIGNKAKVIAYTCLGASQTNQQWYLRRVRQGVYRVQAVHSGKCLEVADSKTTDGARVQQFDCHGLPNQQWVFQWGPNGSSYTMVPQHAHSKCLTINPLGDAVLWECTGAIYGDKLVEVEPF